MNSPISIEKIIGMTDEEYKKYLSSLLKADDAVHLIDELDDELLKIVERNPKDVERICEINSLMFSTLETGDLRGYLQSYNYNTLMLAALFQNNILKSKSVFFEGITFCLEKKQHMAGKSLSQNVFRLFTSNKIPLDEAPYFLTIVTDFYNSIGQYDDTIDALCAAASHFADVSAFQSAYRAINDAQDIAISQKLHRSQIRILETQGIVALIEGDLDCAEAEFNKCLDYYESIVETPPFQLISNAALVQLRKGDYVAARDSYQKLINDYSEFIDTAQYAQIRINLLVCCRELKDSAEIDKLARQIEASLEQYDIEARIEARLVLSKTYFHLDKPRQGANHLKEACIDIQHQIDQYQRLHYRRGVRDQYISRIKSMLININNSGTPEDILHTLVFCTSNSLLDWFSALEWMESIQQDSRVPVSLKNNLSTQKEKLINYGTPFMYGFREKYDDPFEFGNVQNSEKLDPEVVKQFDYSLPWREFNELTAQICQAYSYPLPLEGASIKNGVNTVKWHILSGSCFLFSFVCKEACVFVLITEDKYIKKEMPIENLMKFLTSLYEYQHGDVSRSAFHNELIELQKCLNPTLNPIIETIENSLISELIFVPDYLTETIPILPLILANDELRSRIKASEFIFKTCPTIKEQSSGNKNLESVLFVHNSEEGLELAESEKDIIKNSLGGKECIEFDLQHDKVDFSETQVQSACILHLATHSIPANSFTDPFFVSTSTDSSKNSIWLESVQREAHKLNFRLVFLNGCNTGTTGNKNYFKNFFTNEKVGLSSAFLLNRKCSVIATQWNEPDIIGYIFTSLFYKRFAFHPDKDRAFILALLDMYELTKENAIKLLKKIQNISVQQKWGEALNRSPNEFIFRNTYILGMFQYHSLLFRQ